MKKVISNLFLVVCVLSFLCGFTSCEKEEVSMYGSVYGLITDTSGNPIQAASVTLSPSGKSTVSGSDGRFEFKDLDAGQYSLTVQKDNFQSDVKTLSINAGETTRIDIMLSEIAKNVSYELSVSSLNLSETVPSLYFEISNTGNSGDLIWSIEGIPTWLSFSPAAGTTGKGKSTAVVVSADLNKQTSSTSAVVRVVSGSESKPLTIYLSYQESNPLDMSISELYFDVKDSEKTFTISNISNGVAEFQFINNPSWITFSPAEGTIDSKATTVITAKIDRTQIEKSQNATAYLSSGRFSKAFAIKVAVENSSVPDDPNTPDDPDNPGETENPFINTEIISNSDNLQYELISSSWQANSIVAVSFYVTNTSKSDINLQMSSGSDSYAYDDQGNKCSIKEIHLGTEDGARYTTIPPGVRTKGYFKISGADPDSKSFTNVTIYCSQPSYTDLRFNNLPILK